MSVRKLLLIFLLVPSICFAGMGSSYFDFDLAPSGADAERRVQWNAAAGTLDVGLPGGVVGQMFQEMFFDAKNGTASTVTNGTPVMFAAPVGTSGKVEFQLAIADGTIPSEFIMGVTTEEIISGGFGKVTWFGKVRGVDTTGTPYGEVWADGDLIYVSSTAGDLTSVTPSAPAQRILVAAVTDTHAINGTLMLRPSWHGKFVDLDDVNGTPLTVTGQMPVWDNAASYFDFNYNITDYQLKADFTSGSVLFRGASIITEDNTNFFYDDATNKLKLGSLTASMPVWTDASQQLVSKAINVDINYPLSLYDAAPSRASETNWHGGFLSLATAQPLDSVPTDIVVTKGTGKIVIVVNAGSDFAGDIRILGTSVNRDTGATTPADTEIITIDALTTDGTTTDANGNTVHAFTGAYISSKWYHGSVTLSTADVTLTDVDVYHVSFEQNNDNTNMTLETLDANIYTTNVAAEFDCYLFGIRVTGSKCDVVAGAELHVGSGGMTAIANKYERLRQGNINETFDGTTDGWWVDVHYSNSPSYIEDVTITVWVNKAQVAY